MSNYHIICRDILLPCGCRLDGKMSVTETEIESGRATIAIIAADHKTRCKHWPDKETEQAFYDRHKLMRKELAKVLDE